MQVSEGSVKCIFVDSGWLRLLRCFLVWLSICSYDSAYLEFKKDRWRESPGSRLICKVIVINPDQPEHINTKLNSKQYAKECNSCSTMNNPGDSLCRWKSKERGKSTVTVVTRIHQRSLAVVLCLRASKVTALRMVLDMDFSTTGKVYHRRSWSLVSEYIFRIDMRVTTLLLYLIIFHRYKYSVDTMFPHAFVWALYKCDYTPCSHFDRIGCVLSEILNSLPFPSGPMV